MAKKAKELITEGPLTIKCPICGALAQRPCKDYSGAPMKGQYGKSATHFKNYAGSARAPHQARIDRALTPA